MSGAKPDGGPAYPIQGIDHESAAFVMSVGLSLRDYFAGQALRCIVQSVSKADVVFWEAVATEAYQAADAMIAERAK